MFCRNCGKEINETDKFCISCGSNIEESVPNLDNLKEKAKTPIVNEVADASIPSNYIEMQPTLQSHQVEKQRIDFGLFCTNCGTKLKKEKLCPSCNYPTKNEARKNCRFCGGVVSNSVCSVCKTPIKKHILEVIFRVTACILIVILLIDAVMELIGGNFLLMAMEGGIGVSICIFVFRKVQINKIKSFLKAKEFSGRWIYVIYAGIIALSIFTMSIGRALTEDKKDSLSGDNLAAYNLIIEASYDFKNPSSVRLVSGQVYFDEEELEYAGWFALSATNGFGGRDTGYYFISYLDGEQFTLDLEENGTESSINFAKEKNALDIDSINEALAEYWGNSWE